MQTRKKAQSTLYEIQEALLRLLAPILAFTAEEAWQFLPGDKEESVHLARFPEPVPEYDNDCAVHPVGHAPAGTRTGSQTA